MQMTNENGDERTVGFEIEYAAVPLEDAAKVVQHVYGGEIKAENTALCFVENTKLGSIRLELDAALLQKLASHMHTLGEVPEEKVTILQSLQQRLGGAVGDAGAQIAPYEIVTPPIPIRQIEQLDALCDALRDAGAHGTKAALHYAFGMHINPEVVSFKTASIVRYLQSFLLLAPWLKHQHKVDMTRRVTGFIDPFPASYAKHILQPEYHPDFKALVREYHAHNPTRNRTLDMLPLFAHMDEDYVRSLYGEEEKINPRPTFHYRLPNCEIDDAQWSPILEWERWLMVEALAEEEERFDALLKQWLDYQEKWLSMESQWVQQVDAFMEQK